MRAYPKVACRLDELAVESRNLRQPRSVELLAQLEATINRLNKEHVLVTQERLQTEGFKLELLNRYKITRERLRAIPHEIPKPSHSQITHSSDPDPIKLLRSFLNNSTTTQIQLTMQFVARLLDVPQAQIRACPQLIGAITETLEMLRNRLMQYAQDHDITFTDLQSSGATAYSYEDLVDCEEVSLWLTEAIHQCRTTANDLLLCVVWELVTLWKKEGRKLTQTAIADQIGVKAAILRNHPEIHGLMEELREERHSERQKYQDDLAERARQYTNERRAANLVVTHQIIAEFLGVKIATLRGYPAMRAAFDDLSQQKKVASEQHETELLAKVEAANISLAGINPKVRQNDIADLVGLSVAGLKHYPRVRARLKEIADRYN